MFSHCSHLPYFTVGLSTMYYTINGTWAGKGSYIYFRRHGVKPEVCYQCRRSHMATVVSPIYSQLIYIYSPQFLLG